MTEPATPTGETILVVEGGPPARRYLGQMLRGHGYQLLEATTGDEALDLAANHSGSIALLVTDVVMPNMSGFTLGERLFASHPETRVLFLSGYTDQSVTGGLKATGQAFLLRPFTYDRLIQTIREQLDTEAGSDRFGVDDRRAWTDRRASGDRRTIRL